MPITFNSVPSNLRVPFVAVEFDSSRAVQGTAIKTWRGLLVGQMLATGSATALEPVRIYSADDAHALFGPGSQLYHQARAWFLNNRYTEVWACPLADNSGTKATGTITCVGAATAGGTFYLYVNGTRLQVAVANGDDVTAQALAIETAINADTTLPVTASAAVGVVTLTAKHEGTLGNSLDVRLNYNVGEVLPAGTALTVAPIGSVVTGATDPDYATVWPELGEIQYDVMALGLATAAVLTSADTELEDRWGPMRPLDGVAIVGERDTLANLVTKGGTLNSKHLCVLGADESPSAPWEWSAAAAGQVALSGAADPGRPFQTLPLTGLYAPIGAKRFELTERNTLLYAGMATYRVDEGGTVRVDRLISTYQTNALGAADPSFLDLNVHLVLGYLRWSLRNRLALRFPRHKLAQDGTKFSKGQSVVTPSVVRGELVALFGEWEALGLVEDAEAFRADLLVEINSSDPNRLDVLMPPDLVNQLRVTAVKMEFRL